MLNVEDIQSDFNSHHNNKVDRFNLKFGDSVGFMDHRCNGELYGIAVKLNQKTATIKLSTGQQWRVYYQSLYLLFAIGVHNSILLKKIRGAL